MKKIAVFCCMLLTLGASSALASMSGTLIANQVNPDYSIDPGMIGINAISADLTWTVDHLESGLWEYTYTISPLKTNKTSGAGSIIVEFGSTPTDLDWTYSYSETATYYEYMHTATTDETVKTIDRTWDGITDSQYDSYLNEFDKDNSRVNVATIFEGMEWLLGDGTDYYAFGSDSGGLTLSITTDLAPTWGNIYFDGFNDTTHNGYGMLRNTNYDIDPTAAFIYDSAFVYAGSGFEGWVATPGVAAVPVPASLLLFGSGLGGLFILKRRNQAC